MRDADHGRLGDAGQRVDLALDLLRIDVEAAGDDQVLGAPDDRDVAARVDPSEIAGDEETVGAELGRGLVGHPPIALEDVRAADLDHAELAVGQWSAGLGIGDADLDPRQGKADRAGDAVAVIGVGGVHVGLGHAVALEDGVTGAVPEFPVRLGERQRRAGDEKAHMAGRPAGQPGMLEEPHVEGRHAHQRRGARYQRQDCVGVELGQEQHRGAGEEHRVGRHEEAVGVIDRQGVEKHVAGPEAPGIDEREGVRDEVRVGEHRALRAAGRAGRIEDRGEIVGASLNPRKIRRLSLGKLDQRTPPGRVERFDRRALGECRDTGSPRRVADDQPRFGVADEIGKLGKRVGGVEGQIDRPGAQAGEIEDERLGGLLGLDGDAVARFDAAGAESVGEAPREGDRFGIGEAAALAGLDQHLLRFGERTEDAVEQVSVHLGGVQANSQSFRDRTIGAAANLRNRSRTEPAAGPR